MEQLTEQIQLGMVLYSEIDGDGIMKGINVSVFGWAFFGEYFVTYFVIIRDWSLITGRGGGLQNRRGGHVKFYPYEKGGRKRFKPC